MRSLPFRFTFLSFFYFCFIFNIIIFSWYYFVLFIFLFNFILLSFPFFFK